MEIPWRSCNHREVIIADSSTGHVRHRLRHHNYRSGPLSEAERWVTNIIEAIGEGDTSKGLGTRTAGELHPAERDWMNARTALSAWCAGQPAASVEIKIGGRSASCLLSKLGQRSALKEWQVQRVIERIREFIGWPRSMHHDDSVYVFMEECGADWEPPGDAECPEYYREHEDFWKQTMQMRIHDTVNGEAADISLAVAIDVMFPCNWNFVDNLDIVEGALATEGSPLRRTAVSCNGDPSLRSG